MTVEINSVKTTVSAKTDNESKLDFVFITYIIHGWIKYMAVDKNPKYLELKIILFPFLINSKKTKGDIKKIVNRLSKVDVGIYQ